MRRSRFLVLAVALAALLAAPLCVAAESFRPIVLDPSYDHTKYAPKCGAGDIFRQFRAYSTCFDGEDDDDGDGVPDRWAIPHWVAYQIKRHEGGLGPGPKRPGKWITDPELFAWGIAPSDASYAFSKRFREDNPDSPQLGYDRGHLCMKQHAWRLGADADWNTHTVLNAAPQKADLNQGIWQDLENKTAQWADELGSVWVIAGPVVLNRRPSKWLGEPGEVPVAIPEAFFKVVVTETGEGIKVLAYLYPQEGTGYKKKGGYDHTPYLTSVEEIEEMTGLDLVPEVGKIESIEIKERDHSEEYVEIQK